jgi:SAM-dependent methyltransferase
MRRENHLERTKWKAWLASWEKQQRSLIPNREARFEAMFDFLEALISRKDFLALDLGCGPGSLSARLIKRFPQARVVAIDYDPVLLKISREALYSYRSRITWIEADLRNSIWTQKLPSSSYEAALSTTALHWLNEPQLNHLYKSMAKHLRSGGIFLNGDYMSWDSSQKNLLKMSEKIRNNYFGTNDSEMSEWRSWWRDFENKEKGLKLLFEERNRRFGKPSQSHSHDVSLSVQKDLLIKGGFKVAEVVWQDQYGNRVLLGIK